MGIGEVIQLWKDYGVFEFYLPFVLMFTIFYGLLNKSKLFGDPKTEKQATNINVVVSFVAALFVMVYTPAGITLTTFFGTFFTQTMVVLTTVLCFALILYMMLPAGAIEQMFKDPSKYAKYIIPIAALIVLTIFFAAGGPKIFGIDFSFGTPSYGIGLSEESIMTIILILVFILVIWFITRSEKEDKKKGDKGTSDEPTYKLVRFP